MAKEPSGSSALLRRIAQGDESALVELFGRHHGRLKRMVSLRLDRRLEGRIDTSDVLQEVDLDVSRAGIPGQPLHAGVRLAALDHLATAGDAASACRNRRGDVVAE
jgi:hypothetical protein